MSRSRSSHRLRNVLTPRGLLVVAASFGLFAYIAAPVRSPERALFVWNVSASAPIGLYRVTHGRALARGDLVLAQPAPALAAFAARRGYLPMGVPLVKRIAALAGDAVCARQMQIVIDGRLAAARRAADSKHRFLPVWSGCRTLSVGEVFLLMANVPNSFDGRYFGPTKVSQIAGKLEPLWTR